MCGTRWILRQMWKFSPRYIGGSMSYVWPITTYWWWWYGPRNSLRIQWKLRMVAVGFEQSRWWHFDPFLQVLNNILWPEFFFRKCIFFCEEKKIFSMIFHNILIFFSWWVNDIGVCWKECWVNFDFCCLFVDCPGA